MLDSIDGNERLIRVENMSYTVILPNPTSHNYLNKENLVIKIFLGEKRDPRTNIVKIQSNALKF